MKRRKFLSLGLLGLFGSSFIFGNDKLSEKKSITPDQNKDWPSRLKETKHTLIKKPLKQEYKIEVKGNKVSKTQIDTLIRKFDSIVVKSS